jgi:MYXO-CTERM domain-containing protein
MLFRTLAKRCRRLSPLLAAPAALLLTQGEAKAILTYNIFESAGNVVVQASGSLDLTGATLNGSARCGGEGAIFINPAIICTGTDLLSNVDAYLVAGPTGFNGSSGVFVFPASSVSGIFTYLDAGLGNHFTIDPTYSYNTSIVSSATFNGRTLAGLGLTTTGLIGTWTIDGTTESINVCIGADPCAPVPSSVPGPLPLLGAGAAFGWSRRLRKRIAAPLITPPQA